MDIDIIHEQLNQVMNVKPNLDRKELMKRISQNKVDKVVVFIKTDCYDLDLN